MFGDDAWQYHGIAYDAKNDRWISAHDQNGGQVKVVASTVSGTSFTKGSASTISSSHSSGSEFVEVFYDPTHERTYVLYREQSNSNYALAEVTGTGTSVTIGSGTTLGIPKAGSRAYGNGMVTSGNGQWWVFGQLGSSVDVISYLPVTVNASGAPTVGSTTVLYTGSSNSYAGYYAAAAIDSAGTGIVAFATDSPKTTNGIAFTVSGTTLSAGSLNTSIGAGATNTRQSWGVAANATAGKFTMFYQSDTAGGINVRGVTVSGTTITTHTAVQISGTTTDFFLLRGIKSLTTNKDKVFIPFYRGSSSSPYADIMYVIATRSGDTMSLGSTGYILDVTTANMSYPTQNAIGIAGNSSGTYIVQYPHRLGSGSAQLSGGGALVAIDARVFKLAQTSNFAEWVGIAQATVSDGATVGIDLPGGVNAQQSGMTIEGQYLSLIHI